MRTAENADLRRALLVQSGSGQEGANLPRVHAVLPFEREDPADSRMAGITASPPSARQSRTWRLGNPLHTPTSRHISRELSPEALSSLWRPDLAPEHPITFAHEDNSPRLFSAHQYPTLKGMITLTITAEDRRRSQARAAELEITPAMYRDLLFVQRRVRILLEPLGVDRKLPRARAENPFYCARRVSACMSELVRPMFTARADPDTNPTNISSRFAEKPADGLLGGIPCHERNRSGHR